MKSPIDNTEAGYDAVAEEYVRRIYDELKDKPLDCELLERFAAMTRDVGPVADTGSSNHAAGRYFQSCRHVDATV